MFSLATPLALLGLTSLLVPLALHLVRRPTRTVRLASLRFIPKDRLRVRAVRWRERLLLAARCGLLAALALLLAGPRWQPEEVEPVRWLVRAPHGDFNDAASAAWARWTDQGYLSAPGGWPEGQGAWSRLRELDGQAPAGSEAVVFAPLVADQLDGIRPTLRHLRVQWIETERTAAPGGSGEATAAAPLRVALVAAPDRAEDAGYVRAALAAVAAESGGRVVLEEAAPAVVVALGAVTLPSTWQPTDILVDAGADEPALRSPRTVRLADDTRVRLWRRAPAAEGAKVLVDDAGEPVLTVRRDGGIRRWTWAGRFNPSWTPWLREAGFPAWWRDWLGEGRLGRMADPTLAGAQRVASEQAQPKLEPLAGAAAVPAWIDLRGACWAVLVMLFIVERLLAWRAGRRRVEGSPA